MQSADILAKLTVRHMRSTDAARCSHVVAELTALSFLIERGLATHEEVIERLRLVQKTMPPRYRKPDVSGRVEVLVGALSQVYGPKKRGWTPTVIEGGLAEDPASDPAEPTE